MRQPIGPSYGFSGSQFSFPSGVKWLLIANTVIFVLYYLSYVFGFSFLFRPFSLVPAEAVGGLQIWRVFTYLFLHDPTGFGHILLNMLSLYMFGKTLEETWGTDRFLRFYFACGMGAGLCVIVAGYLTGTQSIPTIGASGAIFGLLLAFGMLFPDATVMFSFLFPIKAKYMVMIIGGITFLSSFGPNQGVSNIAHLGGMLVGFFLVRRMRGQTIRHRSGPGIRRRIEDWYRDFKIQRARKKFQVYMNKQNRKGGPYVN